MPTPKIFESEYRFCLILWENKPIKSTELTKLCKQKLDWSKTTTYTVHQAADGTGRGQKRKCRSHVSDFQGGSPAQRTGRASGQGLIKEDLFGNATYWHEPYVVFDNPVFKKMAVNSGNSSSAVEMRILDADGNVVMEPFVIEPGKVFSLEKLEDNTPYIAEYRADGDYYAFTFM